MNKIDKTKWPNVKSVAGSGGMPRLEHIRWLNEHAGYGEKNWAWGDGNNYNDIVFYIKDPQVATMFRMSI